MVRGTTHNHTAATAVDTLDLVKHVLRLRDEAMWVAERPEDQERLRDQFTKHGNHCPLGV